MANKDTPLGLVPIRHSNGAPYNGAFSEYYVPASVEALGVGDPVIISGTSNTAAYMGNVPGTLPAIIKATAAGGYISGVIVGFNLLPDDLTKTYNAASTERCLLYTSPSPRDS